MAQVMNWPALLIPRQAEFFPDSQTRSGGQSINGSEQVIVGPGRWRAQLDIPVRGEERVLAWRALLASLQGRAGTVLVPKWDRYRPRNVNGRKFSELGTAAIGDCELWFDLSGFGQDSTEQARLTQQASLGDTRISVALLDGDGPRPGHYFSIGDRIYVVQRTWQIDEQSDTVIEFWPTLRALAPANTLVILDRPACLMRLARDDAGRAILTDRRSGVVSLEFVEAW